MIKTAGLSSLGPAMVEPERVLAACKSAILGRKFLTSRTDGRLQTQAMEMKLKSSSSYRVCGMRYGKVYGSCTGRSNICLRNVSRKEEKKATTLYHAPREAGALS